MTGKEFLDALAATGTGESKLAPARALLAGNKNAGPLELYNAIEQGGAPPMTLKKARDILETPDAGPAGGLKFPVRAPAGGITINDKRFLAGEVIPQTAVDAAPGDVLKALCDRGAHDEAPPHDAPPKPPTPPHAPPGQPQPPTPPSAPPPAPPAPPAPPHEPAAHTEPPKPPASPPAPGRRNH
jgi:hypothetical protein